MAHISKRAILAGLGLAAALGGCGTAPMIDKMLPAEAGARPATPYEYPAVHDIPPPRAVPAMSEEQQLKVEKELVTLRDRQEAHEETGKNPVKGAHKKPAKKQPASADNAQAAGAKTNP
jgi:hypothetical protein